MEYAIGLFLPPFIDYVNKNVVSGAEKASITVIVCLLVACIIDQAMFLHGTFTDAKSILLLAFTLTGEAMTVYEVYWEKSKLRVKLPGNGINQVVQ